MPLQHLFSLIKSIESEDKVRLQVHLDLMRLLCVDWYVIQGREWESLPHRSSSSLSSLYFYKNCRCTEVTPSTAFFQFSLCLFCLQQCDTTSPKFIPSNICGVTEQSINIDWISVLPCVKRIKQHINVCVAIWYKAKQKAAPVYFVLIYSSNWGNGTGLNMHVTCNNLSMLTTDDTYPNTKRGF